MSLSPGGQRLVGIASQMVNLAAEADVAIRQAQGAPARLRVVATSTVAEFVVPPVLAAFTARTPRVEADVGVSTAGEMSALLFERLADVAFGPRLSGGLDSTPVMRYGLIVVASPLHRLAGAEQIPWRVLTQEDWFVDPSGMDPSTEVGMLLAKLHIPPGRVRVFPSLSAAWAATQDGHGVAPAISHLVAGDLQPRCVAAP